MHKETIRVIIKEPGKEPREEHAFPNTLEAFQKAVGGHIEAVAVSHDVLLICNEEGLLDRLPYNFDGWIGKRGIMFVGTVVAVGVKGPEFASLRNQDVSWVMEMMGGGHGK